MMKILNFAYISVQVGKRRENLMRRLLVSEEQTTTAIEVTEVEVVIVDTEVVVASEAVVGCAVA